MTKLIKVRNENSYILEGIITDDDINFLNSLNERTVVSLKNTKGLSSYQISKINNNNVLFSVVSGLGEIIDTKNGIDKKRYKERTYLSYMGLATILYYFEQIESELEYEWTDTQKAMYVYSVLASNIEYVKEFDSESFVSDGVMPRSLNGILYNKLTCAGFALVFKEMMDRLGIECHFQNKTGSHDFNIINLDGNYYGIDVTWDNCYGKDTNICEFKQFGRDPQFYNDVYHRKGVFVSDLLYEEIQNGNIKMEEWTQEYLKWEFDLDYTKKWDEQHTHFVPFVGEELFDIKIFGDAEYEGNLNVIKEKLLKRKKIAIHLDQSDEGIRKKILPYDTISENKEKGKAEEKRKIEDRFKFDLVKDYQMFRIYEYLNKYSLIDRNVVDVFDLVIKYRKGYILDCVYEYSLDKEDGLFEYYNKLDISEKIDAGDMNKSLKSDAEKYLKNLIDELIEQMPLFINSYNLFKESNELYDKFYVLDLYSKIKILLLGKDALVKLGYRSEEISNLFERYKNYLENSDKNISVNSKEYDIAFIYEVFSDLEEIKGCMETYEGKEISSEEFMNKFLNVNYMMKVFAKLKDYDISMEEYATIFNDILNKRNKKGK